MENGQFAENCYLLAPGGSTDAVILDPGEEPERFLMEARRRGWTITAIWLTHAHIDHILGVGRIQAATQAPIHLHPADRLIYDNLSNQARLFGLEAPSAPKPDHVLTHGQRLMLGPISFEVRHTPGHSPGSVCFVTDGIVLGGDVLFQGSVGRTDLPGGSFETLASSIHTQLFTLPDDTVVYPGHGRHTTIGAERLTNPFVGE